jgi:hypothetical protein
MIVSEVENLIELINHKSQLQQNVSQRAGFRTRSEELQKNLADLEQRIEVVKAFTNRGFEKPDVSSKSFAVHSQINTIFENFRQDPSSIISFNNVIFKSALKSLNSGLDQFISQSWRAYTDRARQINPQVLEGLGTIPMFSGMVQKVRILTIQIDGCRKNTPISEADFKKFDSLVIDAEKVWNELGSTELPKDVEDFLRAAGSREGAPLDLLTTEVKEWLSLKEINNSFRIHMKSSGE